MVYIDYSGVGDDTSVIRPEWLKPFAMGKFSCM